MVDVEGLLSVIGSYNPASNLQIIREACSYGQKMHRGQFRHSGEPYFTHPFAVASILADHRLDDASIATALLHDTLEDTKSTYDELSRRFGSEIADLVDGVTKLTNLSLESVKEREAEDFRKLLLAMSRDVRVIMVKLTDRLHNMKTIQHLPPHKQERKARETMDIYAPLAGRMGMQWMRDELEDHAFRILNPRGRKSIMRRFLSLKRQTGDLIPRITEDVRDVLERAGVQATVSGREKKPYSVWRKLQEKKEEFSRLSDIFGFRIITGSEEDAYKALGAVHGRWSAVPGRFKDYISQPKANGYRSIHTTVSGRDGKQVEIQIRTQTMHEVAETGIAAHWSYRDGVRVRNPFVVDPGSWISDLVNGLVAGEPYENLLEHVKLEMFSDKVFCFTPNGKVIGLPKGATPIDFAYAIHTNVGSECAGAKVDGRRVPLWTELRNGQTVEILTAHGQKPSSLWMEHAATGRARAAIRRALKMEKEQSEINFGRELARVALDHIGKPATDRALQIAANRFGFGSANELLVRIGRAEITGSDLVEALYPELLPRADDSTARPPCRIVGLSSGQYAKGTECCHPLPGERIVGIATRGKGVQVHMVQCDELVAYEDQPERWIDLQWSDGSRSESHKAWVDVIMQNSAGVLGRICTLIGEQKSNISDLHFTDRKPDYYRMLFEIEVRDVEHLYHVMTAVEADSNVAHVERSQGRVLPTPAAVRS